MKNKSLYEIALDMGISEYSLYCYLNEYANISMKRRKFIENYLEKVDKKV
jgi:hypothetical protein